MTLGQLNVCGEIYHIRMDHQPQAHFPSDLPRPPQALSNTALNQHDYINKSGYPLPYTGAGLSNHRAAASGGGMVLPDLAQSDIRSISVDPGSLDEQLSSQGSGEGGAGVAIMEGGMAGRKKGGGEFSGSDGADTGSELVVGVSSGSFRSTSGTLKPQIGSVSV